MFKYLKKIRYFVLTVLPYGCHLWHNYAQYTFNRIRVGYNDAYRVLHGIPRFMSTKEGLVAAEIPTFQALIRRNVYGFV